MGNWFPGEPGTELRMENEKNQLTLVLFENNNKKLRKKKPTRKIKLAYLLGVVVLFLERKKRRNVALSRRWVN